MKKHILIYPLIVLLLCGCGAKLKTIESAKNYLETSGEFYDHAATWYSADKTSKLTSPASISFVNGNAIFSGESSPYTIEKKEGGDFRNQGGEFVSKDDYFLIRFCNQRLGGCVIYKLIGDGSGWIEGDRIYSFNIKPLKN